MKPTTKTLIIIGVTLALIAALFPILWIILATVKTKNVLFQIPPPLFFKPTLKHWSHVLIASEAPRYYLNSLLIATGSVLFSLILGAPAAYSLARFPLWRKENIAFTILSIRMMPPAAVAIPIYILYSKLHLLDTRMGLIILYGVFNLPYTVWILRGFFEDIPVEIEESAMVDGTSQLGALVRIVLPIARPGFFATAVFTFVLAINEFFFANILTGRYARPISVAVTQFLPTGVRGTEYGNATVAAMLIMIPSALLYIMFQRFLIRGMTMGALK